MISEIMVRKRLKECLFGNFWINYQTELYPLDFSIQRHINIRGLFNPKAILVEKQKWYYLTYNWRDKGVHNFLKVISVKVNIIRQLEFELAYFEATVQPLHPEEYHSFYLYIDISLMLNMFSVKIFFK